MEESDMTTTIEGIADSSIKKRPRKKHLYSQILQQMEFYFSDANLKKDRFLKKLLEKSKNVPLGIFLRFNKIRALTSSTGEIAKALGTSQLLKVTENGKCVYRVTPVKQKENEDDCVIYVEQLPPDANHEWVKGIFSSYGKVEYVSIPKYKNRAAIKGFAFVEFDTPEAAKNALEAFGSAGCCLPPQIPPEELCSVATFEAVEDSNPDCEAAKSKKGKKRKLENENVESVEESNDDDDAGMVSKKKKKNPIKEAVGVEEPDELEKDCDGKITEETEEMEETNQDDGHEIDAEDEEFLKKTKRLTDEEVDDDDDCNKEAGVGSEKSKKKKRPRKRTKNNSIEKKENDPISLGLRIISKNEWRRLRNKYLNLQREKMHALKKHLARGKFGSNYQSPFNPVKENGSQEIKEQLTPPSSTYIPGVIVSIDLGEPLGEVQSFKNNARNQPGVQYVDINTGESKAHIRCQSAEDAQNLLSKQHWHNMTILEGEAEEAYWEKIKNDRHSKKNSKIRMKRGRNKLLQRAERELSKHIKFDD